MKKSFLLVFVIIWISALKLSAQVSEYIPMLTRENQWNELITYSYDPHNPNFKRTHINKVSSDTLINGNGYFKLIETKDEFASIWLENGYIREEIENRKVYYMRPDNPEQLLYDFDAQVGDTILTYYFENYHLFVEVESVNEVFIGGKLRKQMKVISTSYWDIGKTYKMNHIWIEGIGNTDGLLRSMESDDPNGSPNISLLCFFQNEELIYKHDTSVSDCFVWGNINGLQLINNNSMRIYPNPANDRLVISDSEQTISSIEIFDVLGQKNHGQSFGNTIDISPFSKGLYILKIHHTDGQISYSKFIKK